MRRRFIKIVMGLIFAVLICGSTLPCQAATSVTVSTFSDLRKYLSDKKDYNITIGKNIEITSKLTVVGVKSIVGNGKCLFRAPAYTDSYLIAVSEGASLNLKSDLYISGNADNIKLPSKPLIQVKVNSTLTLGERVNLYNTYADNSGGAINNLGTVYIKGGNIYNCKCNTSGGALQLESGSKRYMSAGRIYNNTSAGCGGAIRQYKNAVFVMSGGKIDNNSCLNTGKAIHTDSIVTLKGTALIDQSNDIYLVTNSLIQLGDWTTPGKVKIATYPEIGRKVVAGGNQYKSYFSWSEKQEKSGERPLCVVGNDLVVGVYYPIVYYTGDSYNKVYYTQNKLYGTPVILLSGGPNKTGYSFQGWYDKTSGGNKVSGLRYSNNAPAKYYSRYLPDSYEVTFCSQNISVAKSKVQYDAVYGNLPTLDREGYVFTGWYLDEACTTAISSSSIVRTPSAHVLYAGWAPASLQVLFDGNGGEVSITQKPVQYNSNYGVLPCPNRLGYEFVGWYTQREGGTICDEATYVTTATTHTLYARWRACNYTVTWDPTGGEESFSVSKVTYGQNYSILPVAQRTGYTLEGWFTSPDGGTRCTESTVVQMAGDHVLYARWNVVKPSVPSNTKPPSTGEQNSTIYIKNISIVGMKPYYIQNKGIRTDGVKMIVQYSDNSSKVLTKGWTIDSYKKSAGQRDVVFHYQGKSCKIRCTWLSNKDLAKIKPTKRVYNGYTGNKYRINFSSSYRTKLKVSYKSSNEKIVKVSKSGLLELKKAGTAYVTVTVCLGTIIEVVKVKIVVKNPTLLTSYSYGKQWNQLQFKAEAKGLANKPYFSSSNSKVAKIDKRTGALKALKTGKVTVTIKAGNWKKRYVIKINQKYKYLIIQ